jgi:hypothetical protein
MRVSGKKADTALCIARSKSRCRDSEIITISTYTNLQYLCNETKDIFMNGTFKCCPNHFMQLYTIHGCKNGTNIPLVYALSPSKTEQCYRSMWSLLLRRNTETNLNLRPEVVHLDFERAMHNAVSAFLLLIVSYCAKASIVSNLVFGIEYDAYSPLSYILQ